ncbi:hypothetical protein BpHYR1_053021 [Brachionus plicatilis]|uniref:Uncharacterized protein n=1 Tax=Brachionus plicatilis TaxID=10195 RepID=A0A3M7PGF0_BRAPC|nr:hypothetical protein BpHYR1_053021 [Brachionus plicatilis]
MKDIISFFSSTQKTQELLDESFSSIESGTDNKKEIIILSEIMITRCTRKSFHLDNEIDFQESVNEELIHTNLYNLSVSHAIEYIFNKLICEFLPKEIHCDSLFVIDLNKFLLADSLADDNGAYVYYGNKNFFFDLSQENGSLDIKNITKTIRLTISNDSKNFDKILFAYVWDKGTSVYDKFLVPKPHVCTKLYKKSNEVRSASINLNRLINNKSTGSLSNVVRSRYQLYTHKYLQNKSKKPVKTDFAFQKNTNDSHQVFIGPIMIHLNQDKQAYLTFAMELKKHDLLHQNKLDNISCFIIDDDQATRSAFKTLNEHKVFEKDQEKLIVEVFGKKQERQNSLLGSKDNNEFYSRSDSLITKLK